MRKYQHKNTSQKHTDIHKLSRKENYQNLWFQQRQSALSQLPYGQEEGRTVREASLSSTIWRHGNSPDKFTSQSPECILPIFRFTGNLDISVFTLTSEEKPGFMVLQWESSQTPSQTSSTMPVRKQDQREGAYQSSLSNLSSQSSPSLSPGNDGNLQMKIRCQLSSATILHLSAEWSWELKRLDALNCACAHTSISLPIVSVYLAQGGNHSACFIWFLLFSSPFPL